MDGDRKYRQHGYQDSGRESSSNSQKPDRGRQGGPKLPLDITGPRLPRLVQTVASPRCYSCSVMLSSDLDYTGACPKCGVALHCCKQCVHFDSSTRFQCLKPIPVRIPAKDQVNTCELFRPRVTVARDGVAMAPSAKAPVITSASPAPRNADDARAAFNSLFKK
jgi:hypothetical protein